MAWLLLVYRARGGYPEPAAYEWQRCLFSLVRRHRMRSGADKTTTIRFLLGLIRAGGGTARLLERFELDPAKRGHAYSRGNQ